MKNYWSCSQFADWLRGTKKLEAGTGAEWDDWRDRAKSQHPIRYWIAEELLDQVQDVLRWPIDTLYNVKYYINNRWVTRTHCLTASPTDIKPGTWQDVGNRFLPCLFNELTNYVEIELAWWHIAWDESARKKFKTPFWGYGWFRWRSWRCPEAGVENLNWQMNLVAKEDYGLSPGDKGYGDPTDQAVSAREIYQLYNWWKNVRPTRPDPYNASGWSDYCEQLRLLNNGSLFGEKTTPELKKLGDQAHKKLDKMEKDFEKEDEQMLIRLIKIRRSLWT